MKNNKLLDIILIQKKMKSSIEDNIDSLLQSIKKISIKNTTIVVFHELSYLKYIGINKEKNNILIIAGGVIPKKDYDFFLLYLEHW